MKLGRRGFLKGLAAAPVVAPALAADVASPAALAGVGAFGSAAQSYGAPSLNGCASGGPGDYEAAQARVTRWLVANGIPQWMRDQIRREVGAPSRLDPDLAAARSFSLSAKMRMQHERDVERRCQAVLDHRLGGQARTAWQKLTGLNLW